MALELTSIAQYDSGSNNCDSEAGELIVRLRNENNLAFINRYENSLIVIDDNIKGVELKVIQSAPRVCAGYVKEGSQVYRRRQQFDANSNVFEFFNTGRLKSDKNKLSSKVIRDRNSPTADNNTHCETERFYSSECCNRYEAEINALGSNHRGIKTEGFASAGGSSGGLSSLNKCRKNEAVNDGMIAGSYSSCNNINNNKNNETVLSLGAEVSAAKNAQNCCRRDDRLPLVGTKRNSFDSVTAGTIGTPARQAQIYKVYCGEAEGKMNLTRDSDIGANNYLNKNTSPSSGSCNAYKSSNRTSRSAESTPEIGGCTTIGLDKSPARPRCKLNENNCLSLCDILRSFNGPISEEQAWALCYQCAKCFKAAIHPPPGAEPTRNERLYDVTDLDHVLLHKDGDVHPTTIRDPPAAQSDSRKPFTSEHKLVFSLGLIVFRALDFELDEDEERRFAPDLEALMTLMTQPEDDSDVEERLRETDDEGIERDSGESEDDPPHQMPDGHGVHPGYIRRTPPLRPRPPAPFSVNTVLQLCTRHLQGTQEQADTHYKAVVRALVAEALELSHFLEKVAADKQGNSSSSAPATGERNLDTLDFNDWARFWVQVIDELRRGVELKKVEGSIGRGGSGSANIGSKRLVRGTGRGIEFELTPYEILMDDIRARRYRLRKTPSPSPHLRKDAHAVILDFIRSRPPLKKASERKLPPLQRQWTPRELLMESIKRPPRPLRPSIGNKKANNECSSQQTTLTRDCSPAAVGGESRRIVLGEVPPVQPEQEQEPAQDVAAQWRLQDNQDVPPSRRNDTSLKGEIFVCDSKIRSISRDKKPPHHQVVATEDDKRRANRNCKSRRRRVRVSGSGARDDSAPGNTELVTTPKSSRRESADPTIAPRYQPRRLIIPLDFKLDGEDDDDDDDDDDVVTRFEDDRNDCWRDDGDDEDLDDDNNAQRGRAGESANPWRRTGGLRLTKNEYHRFCDTQLESYDLATQCPSRRVSSRRHTVVGTTNSGLGSGAGTLSLPHSRPQSRQQEPPNRNDTTSSAKAKDRGLLDPELPSSINSSQDELAQEKSPNKGNASLGNMFLDDRLSLTLEEIVHIRSVLTKAELESLPVEGRVKEDVEKRRVCFLCLKTRFGILGPWGQRCRLCERTVCVKCYSKMRIPTEHFAHVPVVLLSPSLMLSPPSEVDGKDYSSPSHGTVRSLWPRPAGGVGSAPASPASKRRDPTLRNTTPTPTLTPSAAGSSNQDDEGAVCNSLPPSNNSPAAGSAQTLDRGRRFYCSSANSSPARTSASSSRYGAGDLRVAERLRGVAMVVCHDCRIMVLQIIKSSRTTRATIRNNVISRLTLNLSPIYV